MVIIVMTASGMMENIMSTDSNVIIMVNLMIKFNMLIELVVKLMVKPVMILVLKVSLRS